MSQNITNNQRPTINAVDSVSNTPFPLKGTSANGALNVLLTNDIFALSGNITEIAGVAVTTAAAGMMKVGIADGTGTALTSTGAALDINIKSGNITGFATSALQTTGNTSLASIDGKLPANLTVSATRLLVDVTGTVTANAGTNLNTSLLALEAGGNLASIKTDVDNLNLAQGSTTSGQKGNLALGAVTTAAPTYTTAQSNPLSLTTGGALRVDASAATVTVSGTVTTTPPSNASSNIAQINGVTPLMGNGLTGTGSLRVTIASDNTAFAVNSTLSAETTKIIGTVNIAASQTIAVTNTGTFATQSTLAAETTKVIGTVRTADGSGNLYTSNSTTYTAKNAQDSNLLGTLGTAFSTAGKVDVKGADGDVFVRQATATNLKTQAESYQGGAAVSAANPLLVSLANTAANATAIKVDGSAVTQPVSVASTLTVAGSKTNNNAAPGATNIGALVGIANAAAPTYTEGDQVLLSTDLAGNVRVTGSLSVGGTTDNSAYTAGTSTGTPSMGFYHSTIDTVTDGRAATVAITSKRAMMVNLQTAAGVETGVAAAPLQVSLANTAANATAVKVDGSAVTQPVSLASTTVTGTVAVTESGTWTVQPGNTQNTTPWLVKPAISTISTTITRPADTTAYAANDAFSNSTSAPTTGGFTLTGAALASGGTGTITDCIVTASAGTAYLGEIWIFDQAVTNVNDNAAFAISDGEAQTLIGIIPFQTTDTTANNSVSYVTGLNIGYTCVGTANLRFLVKIMAAVTPGNAEVLSVRVKVNN